MTELRLAAAFWTVGWLCSAPVVPAVSAGQPTPVAGGEAVQTIARLAGPASLVQSCPAGAITLAKDASWRPVVSAAPEGAVFCIKTGVHRLQTIYPKHRQQFLGERGSVMSGARVIESFERAGPFWVATGQAQRGPIHGVCKRESPLCNDPSSFFIGDVPLVPVSSLSQLGTGRYFFDHGFGRIYFADDPAGKTVEAAVSAHAFMTNGARDVVVKGITVEKYANPAQRGAIYADEDAAASGWVIEGNEVRLNSGVGILVGSKGIIRANNVHHNGQLGVHPTRDGALVEGNEIAYNNTRGYDASWEAGGLKAALVDGLVMRGNHVHHNNGSGLWCDIECRNVTYEGNLVEHNTDSGIFHEISYDAVIRGNTARYNGQSGSDTSWFWGAQIQVVASQDVQVTENTVIVGPNGNGIVLIDQGRSNMHGTGHYKTVRNTVHHNQIWYTAATGKSGGASDVMHGNANYEIIQAGQNRFDFNDYHISKEGFQGSFSWGSDLYDFEGFRRQGQETNGRIIADLN